MQGKYVDFIKKKEYNWTRDNFHKLDVQISQLRNKDVECVQPIQPPTQKPQGFNDKSVKP